MLNKPTELVRYSTQVKFRNPGSRFDIKENTLLWVSTSSSTAYAKLQDCQNYFLSVDELAKISSKFMKVMSPEICVFVYEEGS